MHKFNYIVISREDTTTPDGKGSFVLATRTVFEDETAAMLYAATISPSRETQVVPGHFAELRFGEVRGTVEHWTKLGLKLRPVTPIFTPSDVVEAAFVKGLRVEFSEQEEGLYNISVHAYRTFDCRGPTLADVCERALAVIFSF